MNITDDHKTEFWFHVSNQNEIPLFGTVDKSIDIDVLLKLSAEIPDDSAQHRNYIQTVLLKEPGLIDLLRPLSGISDKRMYLELSYLFNKAETAPRSRRNILGDSLYQLKKHSLAFFASLIRKSARARERGIQDVNEAGVDLIVRYLVEKGVGTILVAFKKLSHKELAVVIDALVIPSEVQQAETKRRGHGAEWQLAKLLDALGIWFIPTAKHENPMGAVDPNVDRTTFQVLQRGASGGFSFDIIVLDSSGVPQICIQGLIHSSDPGQYGVNKSDETQIIKDCMDEANKNRAQPLELWGLIDGVGFIENPDQTVFKMTRFFDCFIQLKTLFKAGLRLHGMGFIKLSGIRFDQTFYSEDEIEAMFNKYGVEDVPVVKEAIPNHTEVPAGKAWLYIQPRS